MNNIVVLSLIYIAKLNNGVSCLYSCRERVSAALL